MSSRKEARVDMRLIVYWVATAILAVSMLTGGAAELARLPGNVDGIVHELGYPASFLTIAGAGKVLGTLVVLLPGLPRLKEWAYAGFFINMMGAAMSWALHGGEPGHLSVTLCLAALTLVSWGLRPPNRVLGNLVPSQIRVRE